MLLNHRKKRSINMNKMVYNICSNDSPFVAFFDRHYIVAYNKLHSKVIFMPQSIIIYVQ